MELEKGKVYFEVSWPFGTIPEINTYIFIGQGIFEPGQDEYVFQTPSSFGKHGDFSIQKNQEFRAQAEIVIMQKGMIDVLYDLGSLIKLLEKVKNHNTQDLKALFNI